MRLMLNTVYDADTSPWSVPAYRFDILTDHKRAGTISLRIVDTSRLALYAGHVGFEIEPQFRGRRLAERAIRLLLPLAKSHDLDPLWFTCAPENHASQRTLRRLGAVLVETVELPPNYDAYARGERQKLRYRLDLP